MDVLPQKSRLLYLYQYLTQNTDAEHRVRAEDLRGHLQERGIEVARKSLYEDLAILRQFGLDIRASKGRGATYYVASRNFAWADLMRLADAVAEAELLTDKRVKELQKKLTTLTSIHQGAYLPRQVYREDRGRYATESFLATLETIQRAIALHQQLSFRYYTWDVHKTKVYQADGAHIAASPYGVTKDGPHYLLYAGLGKEAEVNRYRLDLMEDVEILPLALLRNETYQAYDAKTRPGKLFNHFNGKEERLQLQLDNSLAQSILDRFGSQTILYKNPDNTFTIDVYARINNAFWAWLFAFGPQAKLLGPDQLRENYVHLLRQNLLRYEPLHQTPAPMTMPVSLPVPQGAAEQEAVDPESTSF